MHHRRNRTGRREVKRLDSKSFRMAEKEAMDRPPSVPTQLNWYRRGPDLPIPDDVSSNGKIRGGKKKRSKKERCPINGAHKWSREWVEETDTYREILRNCAICAVRHGEWEAEKKRRNIPYDPWMNPYNRFYCHLHGPKKTFTERIKIATCVHCGKSKREAYETDKYTSWRVELAKRRALPKRTVKLY